jgi:MFS family permease
MIHNSHSILGIHRIRKELKEVYENQIMDKFAENLMIIFIPIYLVTIGYGFASAIMALLVVEITTVLLAVPAGFVSSRVGLKHAILYRTPLTVFFVLWLYIMPGMEMGPGNIVLIGFLWGVSRTIYWIALNSEFVENSDKIHRGEEVGILYSFPMLTAIVSPIIGSLILEFMGFGSLFGTFIFILLLSTVPLFMTKDYNKIFEFGAKDISFNVKNRFNIAFVFLGFALIGEFMLWPFYTYLTFGSLISTAMVASLGTLGLAFFTFLLGKMSDRIKRTNMLILGSVGYAIIWFTRYFASTNIEFFVLSFMGGIFIVLIRIPMFSSFSDKAKEGNIVNHVVQREISLSIGRCFLLSVMVMTMIGLREALLVIGFGCFLLMIADVR